MAKLKINRYNAQYAKWMLAYQVWYYNNEVK
jgi:hypothetical protein